MFDHVLLLGFGGPATPDDVEPFLQHVVRGKPIPQSRLTEVAQHYTAIGGNSPYNQCVAKLHRDLTASLSSASIDLPVFHGLCHSSPWIHSVVQDIHERGLRHGLGVVLAPHRSAASFNKYVHAVETSRAELGTDTPQYEFMAPWHDHPLFIRAHVERVRGLIDVCSLEGDFNPHVIFTAHAIPQAMAEESDYANEVETTCQLVGEELAPLDWCLAYQSRSGRVGEPWLGPDVLGVLEDVSARGAKDVVLVPVGFLCDNAEILFDLDVEAKALCEERDVRYWRSATVMDHPAFVDMLAQSVAGMLQVIRSNR